MRTAVVGSYMTTITTSYVTQAFAMVYCLSDWSLNVFVSPPKRGSRGSRLDLTLMGGGSSSEKVGDFFYFVG